MEWIRKTVAYLWNFRYLPLKYRWPLIKLRRLLFPTETPLHLRHSVRFARSVRHPPLKSPVLFVLGLLWPFPTWKFAAELPLRPRLIIENPKPFHLKGDDLHFLRIIPLWSIRDTPERALYRIYEAVCAGDGDLIAAEIQYFWCKTSWATANIADPECEVQEHYAVMAATAEAIVECFNWRIKMGLRRDDPLFMNAYKEPRPVPPEGCPSWALTVGPLPEKLSLGTGKTYYIAHFNHVTFIHLPAISTLYKTVAVGLTVVLKISIEKKEHARQCDASGRKSMCVWGRCSHYSSVFCLGVFPSLMRRVTRCLSKKNYLTARLKAIKLISCLLTCLKWIFPAIRPDTNAK